MENEVSIDWLSFTVKCDKQEDFEMRNLQELQRKLYIEFYQTPVLKSGRYSYSSAIDYSNAITILYSDIANKDFTANESALDRFLNMGIHVEMSGSGCRLIEQKLKEKGMTFREYLLYLKDFGVSFSRIDVAYDDYKEMLDFDVIEDKMRSDQVVSRIRSKKQVDGYAKIESLNGLQRSKTLYFGSKGSGALIRFYNKLVEQQLKEKYIERGIETWQRYEIVLKREKAKDFVDRYEACEDLGKLYLQIIGGLIRFVDDTHENKSRCETSEFWTKFLNNEDAIQLANREVDSDLSSLITWFDKSVMNNLLVLLTIAESENINLFEELANSNRTLNTKQQNLLTEYFAGDEEFKKKIISEIKFCVSQKK